VEVAWHECVVWVGGQEGKLVKLIDEGDDTSSSPVADLCAKSITSNVLRCIQSNLQMSSHSSSRR
jgi:hypothetical protein